jgi:hypothetical protein
MILLYYFNKNKINYLQMEDTLTRIEEFHAQITSLEDELNEARTETSRIKTEYLNEKSAKEIKISELQTKINEVSFIFFKYLTSLKIIRFLLARGRQNHGNGKKSHYWYQDSPRIGLAKGARRATAFNPRIIYFGA